MIIIRLFLVIVGLFVAEGSLLAKNIEFIEWLQELKKEAQKMGITTHTFDMSLGDLNEPLKRVISSDRNQAETINTFDEYYLSRDLDYRLSDINKIEHEYTQLFTKIKSIYGIDSETLLSFWSLETSLGKIKGKNKITHVLATLAYDKRRGEYFRSELFNALKIIQKEKLDSDEFVGSWAGASGHMQFMPYNILRYGKDGNNDNKINPWQDPEDALMSAAYFLTEKKWIANQPWGWEVAIKNYKGPRKAKYKYFISKGMRIIDSHKIKNSPKKNNYYTLIEPQGKNGLKFLVGNNYFVIKKWNNSQNYALLVGILSDKILGISLSKKISK